MAGLGVWWSKSPQNGNFGDILTPLILNHYGIVHEWVNVHQAEAISTGSIIKFAKKGMTVLGSGAMCQSDKLEPRANYLWVRGPLTRDIVLRDGGDCPELYGDPAMLLPRIYKRTIKPTVKVGYFLHYVDLDMADRFPFVINPLEPVEKVLADIWQCECIVSSSLHGIIAAHAYGIPAAWVKLSDRLRGDHTKFHDHALAVGLAQMPLSTIDQPEFTIATYNNQLLHSELALFAARRKAQG